MALLFTLAALVTQPAGAFDLEGKVSRFVLDNGMRVLVLPRPGYPIISVCMKFRAGSVDEDAGRSGTAHLLEHMLFKGTKILGTRDYAAELPLIGEMDRIAARMDDLRRRIESAGGDPRDNPEYVTLSSRMRVVADEHRRYVVKDEIDALYTRNGAENFNAFTDVDMTTYRVDLPANRLLLWAVVESDRMRNPVLREFYSERDVVMEERRQSYDSDPDRQLMELFLATAFTAHPYGRPIIGWPSDIASLNRPQTEAFFRTRYAPDNAVVAVVGDVHPGTVEALLRKYFGAIEPAGTASPPITREPAQRGERRVVLEADANPVVMIGWHKPTLPHRDDYVLDLVDGILGGGRTSRLYRRLIDGRLASSVNTINGLPGARFDNLFTVSAAPLAPNTPEDVERTIQEEIGRLASEPVPPEELDRVRRRIETDFVRSLDSAPGLANTLAFFESVSGDWRYLTRYTSVVESITPGEIMDVVRRRLIPGGRTVAILRRPEAK